MIEFTGVDIVAERRVDEPMLHRVLAEVLSATAERVAIIEDMAAYPARQNADVVCVRTPVGGQFAEILSIQCEKIVLPQGSVLEIVALVATKLRMACLTPDEGLDPFAMWMISPGRKPELVGLDPKAFDEGCYELERTPM